MSNAGDVRPPRVFVSHAGPDRREAYRLARDLGDHGIETFVDVRDIRPGDNVILTINRELAQSDYFVLLWSQHCEGRAHVEEEFAAAYSRQIRERRSFLFVVRLDRSDPPGLLAPRCHLDAFAGWSEVVAQLVHTWTRDRAVGLPVLPSPRPAGTDDRGMVLYVRNKSLVVAHVLAAPKDCTGLELDGLVRAGLGLPERVVEFDGRVGVEFQYQLMFAGKPVPAGGMLASAGIVDHSTIDLEVRLDFFGPDGPTSNGSTFRNPDKPVPTVPDPRGGGATARAPATARTLARKAFAHLTPWPERR